MSVFTYVCLSVCMSSLGSPSKCLSKKPFKYSSNYVYTRHKLLSPSLHANDVIV